MNVTSTGIAVSLAVVIALSFLLFGQNILALFSENTSGLSTAPATVPGLSGELPTTLTMTDTTIGAGAEATSGDTLTVNYTGFLSDGTVFDSSTGRGPFSFTLGVGQVISGWDQGLVGMKEGGTRRIIIPPSLAYGETGAGNVIPPNATLIFDVELISVTKE